MIDMDNKINSFITRMGKIGIDVTLYSNYPWVYIYRINGKRVTETFKADHGFTLIFMPIKEEQQTQFTDIGEIFKLIRKYTKREKKNA